MVPSAYGSHLFGSQRHRLARRLPKHAGAGEFRAGRSGNGD